MGLVAGAIKAVTPHPNDANVVYIGAVNGGVWKTTDAWSKRPHWQPLTDDQKSLSIGALAFDPKAMAAPCASISNPAPSHRKGPMASLSVRLAASAALAGVPQPQFVSADGRYVVEEPAQIRGVDLKTGNTLWVAPIRDIVDRTSPPP